MRLNGRLADWLNNNKVLIDFLDFFASFLACAAPLIKAHCQIPSFACEIIIIE